MDKHPDDQLLIMQAANEYNRKDFDDKTKNLIEDLKPIMDKIKNPKSSPYRKDSPKAQGPTTFVPANKRYPPLEGVNSRKIVDMWTLKHKIISAKLYELLINI